MERKTRLLPYILVTALCLAIALGASAGYGALERLNRRYYTLVNGAALLAACLCAWLGFSLMWIEFTGYVGLWLFMALLLCALLGDIGAG